MIRQRLLASAFLAAVVIFLWNFPILNVWLTAGFLVYLLLLIRFPHIWLLLIPVAMPLLDLAVTSGWFFFDEFDALVLLTVSVLFWRHRLSAADFHYGRPLNIALLILVSSYIVSMALGLSGWSMVDGNSFASYYSPFNAARIAKGFVWPILLLPFLKKAIEEFPLSSRYFVAGLLLSLLGVGLVSLYEHWLFVGLLNFGHEYRISGPFSSMHTGDGHIDLWLAVTLPLATIPFFQRWKLHWKLAALGLCAVSFYVLIATASRGPFLAITGAFVAIFAAVFFVWIRQGNFLRSLLVYPMVAIFALVLSAPFLVPTELGNRFKRTIEDSQVRLSHFREALSMRDRTTATELFGMGLGTFPKLYEKHHIGPYPLARYSFDGTPSQRFLTLYSGDNLYFGQRVATNPDSQYRLGFFYRTNDANARLTVAICEKWLLHSQSCSWNTMKLRPTGAGWSLHETVINLTDTGRPRGKIGDLSKRPVELSLHTTGVKTGLSVDDIIFANNAGKNLLKNGNFSETNNHWFWTVDNHLPWHTKNMAVNVLFDQGWWGLLGVVLLFGIALASIIRNIRARQLDAIPWLGAMVGFLITVVVLSPFDQPRLAMLFYLMCLFCSLQYAPHGKNRQPTAQTRR